MSDRRRARHPRADNRADTPQGSDHAAAGPAPEAALEQMRAYLAEMGVDNEDAYATLADWFNRAGLEELGVPAAATVAHGPLSSASEASEAELFQRPQRFLDVDRIDAAPDF